MAASPAAISGQYAPLTLAVVGGNVSGAFSDGRGENGPGGAPQFTCAFLFRGTLEGDRATITSWTPGDGKRIAGELVFKGDAVTLQLQEDQPGCAMTSGDTVQMPYEVSRTMDGAGWLGVALVSARRASIRVAPGAPAPRKPYLVAFDPVVILERAGEWTRVAYLGGATPVSGWLRATELVAP
jgi:hypothetical protein